MKCTKWTPILTLVAMSLLLPCLFTMRVRAESPKDHGFQDRMEDLGYLGTLSRGVTQAQKTEVMLHWLGEERLHPSETKRGIDSGYLQMQILLNLAIDGDPYAVRQVAVDPGVKQDIRDAMCLVLTRMGDRSQVEHAQQITRASTEYQYRQFGAKALGYAGATESVPFLKELAATDPYVVMGRKPLRDELVPIYPVREAAETAIRMLGNKNSLDEARKRGDAFNEFMAKAEKSPETHKISLPENILVKVKEDSAR